MAAHALMFTGKLIVMLELQNPKRLGGTLKKCENAPNNRSRLCVIPVTLSPLSHESPEAPAAQLWNDLFIDKGWCA